MAISFESHVVVSDQVLCRELDGELVILDLKSEAYFGLDEVGARIWQLFTGDRSIQAVFEALIEEYDVEPETLRADLVELLEQLCDRGLITIP